MTDTRTVDEEAGRVCADCVHTRIFHYDPFDPEETGCIVFECRCPGYRASVAEAGVS